MFLESCDLLPVIITSAVNADSSFARENTLLLVSDSRVFSLSGLPNACAIMNTKFTIME